MPQKGSRTSPDRLRSKLEPRMIVLTATVVLSTVLSRGWLWPLAIPLWAAFGLFALQLLDQPGPPMGVVR